MGMSTEYYTTVTSRTDVDAFLTLFDKTQSTLHSLSVFDHCPDLIHFEHLLCKVWRAQGDTNSGLPIISDNDPLLPLLAQ